MSALSLILAGLKAVGPIVAATAQFKGLYDLAATALHPADQAIAREAYADLVADNDAGHRRLQMKLQAASVSG